jgi:hypothetical protein
VIEANKSLPKLYIEATILQTAIQNPVSGALV